MGGIILDELFKTRLEELIKNSGYSYEFLAKQLGFKSKSTVCKYANKKICKIGPSEISKLAKFFNVSPSWLAGFTDDKYYNI